MSVVFEMNVESVFVVASTPMAAAAFQIEAEALGIEILKVSGEMLFSFKFLLLTQ